MALMHQCYDPSCHKLIPINQRYCSKHQQQHQPFNHYDSKTYNKKRYSQDNIKYTRFYKSRQWRIIRQLVIANADGLCDECLKHGYIKPGKIVDHKIPLRTAYGWTHRLDIDNLQYICQQCHNKKTRHEQQHYNQLLNKYGKDNR